MPYKKKKKKTFVVFFCSQFSPSQIKTLTNFSMNGFVKLILLKYYKEMQQMTSKKSYQNRLKVFLYGIEKLKKQI